MKNLKKTLIFCLIFVIFAAGCKKEEDKTDNTNTGNTPETPATPDTPENPNTMKDIDGNIYKTVKINGLTWMAENLKVEKLNDGTELAIYTTIYDWLQEPQSSHIGAFGYFDNIANYKNQYGCLYDRKSVETGKLCPTGWHVPTKAEWESLFAYAGGNNATASAKLRTISGWLDNNNNEVAGTDALGFSAKAGGQFYAHLEEYDALNHAAFWWASESYQALIRTDRILVSNELWNDRDTRSNGDYVRCVKD